MLYRLSYRGMLGRVSSAARLRWLYQIDAREPAILWTSPIPTIGGIRTESASGGSRSKCPLRVPCVSRWVLPSLSAGSWDFCRSWDSGCFPLVCFCCRSIFISLVVFGAESKSGGGGAEEPKRTAKLIQIPTKKEAGFASGPKALGNGGVSSREDEGSVPL